MPPCCHVGSIPTSDTPKLHLLAVITMSRIEAFYILKHLVGATPAINWYESGKPVPPQVYVIPGWGAGISSTQDLRDWFKSNGIKYS